MIKFKTQNFSICYNTRIFDYLENIVKTLSNHCAKEQDNSLHFTEHFLRGDASHQLVNFQDDLQELKQERVLSQCENQVRQLQPSDSHHDNHGDDSEKMLSMHQSMEALHRFLWQIKLVLRKEEAFEYLMIWLVVGLWSSSCLSYHVLDAMGIHSWHCAVIVFSIMGLWAYLSSQANTIFRPKVKMWLDRKRQIKAMIKQGKKGLINEEALSHFTRMMEKDIEADFAMYQNKTWLEKKRKAQLA
jgi:hypothetical protein